VEISLIDGYDPDNYVTPVAGSYAQRPGPNPTLSLLTGKDTQVLGPAFVAFEEAQKARAESVALWKSAANAEAVGGNINAVAMAAQEITSLQQPNNSYFDNVTAIAEQKAETLAALSAQTGMQPNELVRTVRLHSRNMAVRSALEASIAALPERGFLTQLAQDVTGITTAIDWGRISPTLNEEFKKFGVTPSLTTIGSAEDFFTILAGMDSDDDAKKFISHITDVLVDSNTIPLESSRKFFETMVDLTNRSKGLEGVFGGLDVLGVGLLLKAGATGVLKASRGIAAARAVGAHEAVVQDVVNVLTKEGKTSLETSQVDALKASLSTATDGLAGLSPSVQKALTSRILATKEALENTLYTGGATAPELAASKRMYELTYSRQRNSAILESNVEVDVNKGRITLDTLYVHRDGTPFATAEDALEYGKKWVVGELSVVPIAGEVADIAAKMGDLSSRANTLLTEISALSKETRKAGVRWAEDIGNLERPTSEAIADVWNKVKTGQPLSEGFETTVGKLVSKAASVEEALLAVQRSVPAQIGVKLRELENVVSEKVSLTMGPKRPGYALRQKADMPVLLESLGKYSQDEIDSLHLTAGRLNPRLATVTSIYTPALMSSLKKHKYSRAWAEEVSQAFDKLSGNSIDRVNDALIQTEALKRDMTPAELAVAHIKTEAEQEAYYAYRKMRDAQWAAKNEEARLALTSMGYRNVFSDVGDLGTFSGPARRVDEWEQFYGKRLYDAENNTFSILTEENIHKFKARGLTLYDYAKAQEVPNHKSVATKVMLPTNKTTVGDVKSVVGRVDGSYSRIYMEEYFIKMKGNLVVDGELTDVKYAFRTAATEADAADYVQRFNQLIRMGRVEPEDVRRIMGGYEEDAEALARAVNDGKYANMEAAFNYTRMDDNFFRDVTGIGSSDRSGGRTFWSGRSEEGIRSISTGSRDTVTAGPLASLEREIGNTAMFAAMDEWRRNAIQKWYNTFEDVISPTDKMGTKDAAGVFFNVVNRAKEFRLSDRQANAMMAQARFIVNQLNVRTLDEQILEHNIDKLSRVFDNLPGMTKPGFSHVGQWMRRTDLIEFIKGKASTLMLGLFSPAQLIVQSSGMLNAVAMSPKHGLKSAYLIRPMLAALNSDNGKVWQGIHKMFDVVQYTGMSKEEFTRIAAAIRKTGLIDNIGASSMYGAEDGAANIFSRRMRKFNTAQMGFFNKGEEISRVAAFDIARREWLEVNPGGVWDSDGALASIMQRADDLTMNMQRVNEARYSKGLAGIPLQFLQHNIRLGTNVWGGVTQMFTGKRQALSAKDAVALVVGSTLLYGLNNTATPDMLEEALGSAINGWDDEYKMYVAHGLIAGTINSLSQMFTGESAEIGIGARLSSLQWYEDLYKGIETVFMDNKLELDTLTGPSGSVLVNLWDAGKIGLDFWERPEWTTTDFLGTLSKMGATMASSWGNADKAWYAAQVDGYVYNKRGDKVAQLTTPEVIWQAIGISSVEALESGYVFKNNQQHTRMIKKMSEEVMRQQEAARRAWLNGDTSGAKAANDAIAALLLPLKAGDRVAVVRGAASRTNPNNTVIQEAVIKWDQDSQERANKILIER
jgi:hypothetical protein